MKLGNLWRIFRWVRCRNCAHRGEHWITSFHGEGLYKFSYCMAMIVDWKVVEPDIGRQCRHYKKKEAKSESHAL